MEQLKALARYLNCPCRYFPPAEDDRELRKAYDEAAELGKQHGFVPVLIAVDFTLIETLMMNITGQAEEPSREEIDNYRSRMLSLSLADGKTVLKQRLDEWTKESELCMGEFSGQGQSELQSDFEGYWDYFSQKTLPIVLAEIPVKNPWEVFAYLPFGDWNECPDTPELMSVAKYWFERYGAVPAVMTHDVLENLSCQSQLRSRKRLRRLWSSIDSVWILSSRAQKQSVRWRIVYVEILSGISGGINKNKKTKEERGSVFPNPVLLL